jgi:hypothetical protein
MMLRFKNMVIGCACGHDEGTQALAAYSSLDVRIILMELMENNAVDHRSALRNTSSLR